jgi:hypothetical protein
MLSVMHEKNMHNNTATGPVKLLKQNNEETTADDIQLSS